VIHAHHEDQSALRIGLLSYRSNPHSGGQGVYVKNLSRALRDLGHAVDVVSGPPDPGLAEGIRLIPLPGLDLYNPADPFRLPSARELAQPVNLLEWIGVCTMGFPEPFTFGLRAFGFLRHRLNGYDVLHDNQSLSYGIWALGRRAPTVATIHHPLTTDRRWAVRSETSTWKKLQQWRWYSCIGMQKRVVKRLAHLITVSECSRRDIARDFGIPAGRLRVVPNGIDTELFRPLPGVEREPGRLIVTNSADIPQGWRICCVP
jgi:glycosyltransferase involved in cell wall biosynthesis